nr:cytochrome p450 monooxygenase [Quercus suber]
MLTDLLARLLVAYWPALLGLSIAIHLVRNKVHNGLHRYPGPALAAYTNWWRFGSALRRDAEKTQIALHRRHGDIVRLGPNVLSFADPRALKAIYGLNQGLTKSDFYPVQQAVAKGVRLRSLFTAQDEAYHAQYRRCVSGAFAMSSLVGYEPLVDSAMDAFLEQTERRYSGTDAPCDFARWLQFFAFDVIGEVTWSTRLGFVERDEDVEGIVQFVADFLAYAGPVGQMPWLDLVWEKNPLRLQLQRWGWLTTEFAVTRFARKQAAAREEEMERIRRDGKVEEKQGRSVDMLMKFTQAQHDHPEFMTDRQVLASCTSMIFAGSETTAISLSAVFYHLLKHPHVYARLMRELDDASRDGTIRARPWGKVSWAESQRLPYLDAVIQESFRMHPAAGLLLERIVPAQGLDVLGTFIPGGTIVGCNPWVVHRRPEVFGAGVDEFRPERWLDATPEQLRVMKASMFHFGAGARTCIGKNISLLEMYKLVPSFLCNFELRLETPELEWTTYNAWFVRQLGFRTRFRRRTKDARGEKVPVAEL